MNCTVKPVHLLGLHTWDKGWITLLEVPLSQGLRLWSWGVIISPPLVNTSASRKVHIRLRVIRCRMQDAGCRMLLVWLLWLLHSQRQEDFTLTLPVSVVGVSWACVLFFSVTFTESRNQRDDSVAKGTGYSCGGPEFSSQHACGSP